MKSRRKGSGLDALHNAMVDKKMKYEEARYERRRLGADHAGSQREYNTILDDYFYARHALLVAIQKAEVEDVDAIRRKMDYRDVLVSAGAIRPNTGIDDILYYIEGSDVHVFYGGRELRWDQRITSPDGLGHGHAVLSYCPDGTYDCVFQRPPERQR